MAFITPITSITIFHHQCSLFDEYTLRQAPLHQLCRRTPLPAILPRMDAPTCDARLEKHIVVGLKGIIAILEEWTQQGLTISPSWLDEAELAEQRLRMILELHRRKVSAAAGLGDGANG